MTVERKALSKIDSNLFQDLSARECEGVKAGFTSWLSNTGSRRNGVTIVDL